MMTFSTGLSLGPIQYDVPWFRIKSTDGTKVLEIGKPFEETVTFQDKVAGTEVESKHGSANWRGHKLAGTLYRLAEKHYNGFPLTREDSLEVAGKERRQRDDNDIESMKPEKTLPWS